MTFSKWHAFLGSHLLMIVVFHFQYHYVDTAPSSSLALVLSERLMTFVGLSVFIASLSLRSFSTTPAYTQMSSGSERSPSSPSTAVPARGVQGLVRHFTKVLMTCFLLAVFTSLWAFVQHGLWNSLLTGTALSDHTIGIDDSVDADNCALGILLTYCILLDYASLRTWELFVVAAIEIAFNIFNHVITYGLFGAADTGNTLTVILFSMFFGFACLVMMERRNRQSRTEQEQQEVVSTHESFYGDVVDDIASLVSAVSLIGMWVCYPGLASYWAGDPAVDAISAQQSVINTYLSLLASSLCGLYVFALIAEDGDDNIGGGGGDSLVFSFVSSGAAQRAMISGGVAIGVISNAHMRPEIALLIGSLASGASVGGGLRLTPRLEGILGVTDRRHMIATFLIPSMQGGIISILFAISYTISGADVTGIWEAQRSRLVVAQVGGVVLAPLLGCLGGFVTGGYVIPFCMSRNSSGTSNAETVAAPPRPPASTLA